MAVFNPAVPSTFKEMKKKPDATTKKGKIAIYWARRGVKGFLNMYPKYTWQETAVDRYADVDGLLGCASNGRNVIQCVLEVKARSKMTHEQLFGEFEGRWLISYDKLVRGYDIAFGLRSHFICMLVMPKEKRGYLRKIAHYNPETGGLEWSADFEVRKTETQKTCNGGTAFRENAFIDMYKAKQFDV